MAEDTEANAEPSMEEILASIRKIISDEGPVAEAPPPEPAAPEAAAEPVAAADDVLELTQMVQEDGSVVDMAAAEAEPAPQPAPAPASEPEPVMAPEPISPAEPLISEPVASSAASALSSLANTVEIDRLSSLPGGATLLGNGSRTLEDMVVELMRPMLKEWLDGNLPAIVEGLVQKEIERIARRS